MMKVEIVSKENIKPSSPTPGHLKTFNLSLLDQFVTVHYSPIVLFYPNYSEADTLEVLERTTKLKQSLSETLSRFYPLAGTIQDQFSIDCNDTGAYFAVARVNCYLSRFLDKPNLQSINHFLPLKADYYRSLPTTVASIQVNVFQCGGMAIGLCVWHKILDGSGLGTFLKGWASTTCGSEEVVHPDLNSATSLFPSNNQTWVHDLSISTWWSLFKQGKFVTRRFVFESAALEALKAEATRNGVHQPTRVVMVSALIWKCAIDAASRPSGGSQRTSLLTPLVNFRKSSASTLSENSIGNLFWLARVECKTTHQHEMIGLYGLVRLIQDGILQIKTEFLKKLQNNEQLSVLAESIRGIREFVSKEGVDYYNLTSWCKLGFNEADFGWGKPIWVTGIDGSGSSVFLNNINLIEIRGGDGIEAWVTLDETEMNLLQVNPELLAFAAIDTSPLLYGTSTIHKT